ncbi:hypothetical protein A9G07_10110 [Gilliamella sp. wkB72]|nr:hypothetical protein A9G07_10110 [Gilliamella apicola]
MWMLMYERTITITLILDEETNKALIQATKNSRRSKRTEATIRLKDHLKKYPFSNDNFSQIQNEG